AEILVERLQGGVERREDHAVPFADRQALKAVVGELEVGRHAALAAQAALQRHRLESAAEVIGPLMIGTHELLNGAEILPAELQTAVRAAISDDGNAPVAVAHDDDRLVADKRALERALLRNLGRQTDVAPRRPTEDPLLLARVELRIGVDPEWHAGDAIARPGAHHCMTTMNPRKRLRG